MGVRTELTKKLEQARHAQAEALKTLKQLLEKRIEVDKRILTESTKCNQLEKSKFGDHFANIMKGIEKGDIKKDSQHWKNMEALMAEKAKLIPLKEQILPLEDAISRAKRALKEKADAFDKVKAALDDYVLKKETRVKNDAAWVNYKNAVKASLSS